ncbi:hypothetical protein [Neorhizobium galegae]|uniref:hypothetical protein n=1 Tax=Neorhizobium galegae TaxID=399 RepID=UPI000621DE3D|nr:hypothetical protein [Neorhizobium galegae]CDZ54443.1 Hypothetical protein NGAL_HAMBI2427_56460 [Neorhizobium galegae bv. orientalis]
MLAFRLFGHFAWPPLPDTVGTEAPLDGVVDVFFIADGKAQRAALRWTCGRSMPSSEDPALATIDTVSPDDAVKYLGTGEETKSFWIDPIAVADWLAFRGAFLIEQYDKGKLTLRLPLANGFEYDKIHTVYSGLRLLKTGLLGLRLNVPLPLRQSQASEAPAFPFTAVYEASKGLKDDPLQLTKLFGGWTDEGQDEAIPGDEDNYVELSNRLGVKKFQLGSFGFSERGAKPIGFVSYKDNPAIDRNKTWPKNATVFADDLLSRYGFNVREDRLRFSEDEPEDLSLRFFSTDGVVTGLTYRVRVIPQVPANPTDDEDLHSDTVKVSDTQNIVMFKLRLSEELGGMRPDSVFYGSEPRTSVPGWLRLGERISADCTLSWKIEAEEVWSGDRERDWSPEVALQWHWRETISDVAATSVEQDRLFLGGLLSMAQFTFEEARKALLAGETGQPQSFLPSLSLKKQSVLFTLFGSVLKARADPDTGLVVWGRPSDDLGKFTGPWRRPPTRLSLASPTGLMTKDTLKGDRQTIAISAARMSFFDNPKTTFGIELAHDQQWPPTTEDAIDDGPSFFLSYTAVLTDPPEAWHGRLASLEFEAGGETDVSEKPTEIEARLRIGGAGARDGDFRGGSSLRYPGGRISVEFRLVVPLNLVRPVSIDTLRFDRSARAAPLLIPLSLEARPGRYWLDATEVLSARQDRQLSASLYENTPDGKNTNDFVVLSSEPFSVFRFRQEPLANRGRDDTAAVAVYSGDDRIWQYRKVAPYYHYMLPAQAIGESADKPGRLEIHDIGNEKEMPARPFQRNFEPPDDETKYDDAKSNLRRRAVELALTPPAEIWIAPSDVERGYFMPEATSFEIFRQAGAYGLGAALSFFRAEFLYGLPVGIDVSKEIGIARGARIAEIEALVGRLTGPVRETDNDRRLVSRWDAVRSAAMRRPERLEVWARDLKSTVDFTPARFSDGVRFALRGSALHRPPLIDHSDDPVVTENETDYQNWPRLGLATPQIVSLADTITPTKPRHHPQGLSGGALWPVESFNLFRALLEQPESDGGTIEQIALSSLGGDAVQKAEFLGGKVAIISETRNGRVQRQQVEVIGRVCALWHRAKHVVVYERTVNPSAQFAPKFEDDDKRTRSRRPILRKVREYIELLQPVRQYPDFDRATRRSAGFLESVRFNSNIINVDSAWSSEVDKNGWQIPLWNRQASKERPQVYPMPDIAFVSTAEGEGEKPNVAQDCRDPDFLYFYADFKAATSDTDQWAPLIGLDYVNLPNAKAIADSYDTASNAQTGGDSTYGSDGRRRAVSRMLPGLRRFTWRVAPAAQKTAINAGRSGKPVYVGLDSVSFMRAGHTEDSQKALPPQLLGALNSSKQPLGLGQITELNYWTNDGTGVEGALVDFSKIVGNGDKGTLIDTIRSKDANAIEKAIAGVKAQLASTVSDAVTGKLAGFKQEDRNKLATFASGLSSGALCEKLKNDAVTVIKRKQNLISTALEDWVGEVNDGLDRWQANAGQALGYNKGELLVRFKAETISHIQPLFAEATQDVARVEEGVEKARAILLDTEVELELVIKRARQRVDQFNAGYEKDKPWSPERRKAYRAGLAACIASVEADIEAALDEAAQRLAVELNNASQSIAGHVAKFLKDVNVLRGQAADQVSRVGAAVHGVLQQVIVALSELQTLPKLPDGTLPPIGKLHELIAKIEANPDLENKAPALKARAILVLEQARTAIGKIGDLAARANEFDSAIDNALDKVATLVGTITQGITNEADALKQAALDFVDIAEKFAEAEFPDLQIDLTALVTIISKAALDGPVREIDGLLDGIGSEIDAVLLPTIRWLDAGLAKADAALQTIPGKMQPVIDDVQSALKTVKDALAPDALLEKYVSTFIDKGLATVLGPLDDSKLADPVEVIDQIKILRNRIQLFVGEVEQQIEAFGVAGLGALAEVTDACSAVSQGVAEVDQYFAQLAKNAEAYLKGKLAVAGEALQKVYDKYGHTAEAVEKLIAAVGNLDRTVRGLYNDLGRMEQTASAYADRVFDAAGKLTEGGILATPNNVLKLYSAVTSAPELAALKADIDRIRSGYDELSDIIDTTKANALFDRLSDELKAIGLSLPFDKIGESLLPADLHDFDIGGVFRNFGGAKLDNLFRGYKIPQGVADAIKVTHDFDEKQARAWVQVDINAPFPGRRSLFSLGVFKADFVDMQLTGRVRLDASKDQEKVAVTGFGRIGTAIDVVVSGQSMVRFDNFGLAFTKESGLDIQFDPKNVKLNPQFKFIQDFLSSIFPELPGGLEWIRENGVPIGVQHDFAIPNLSLNFGTSGVSNISLENHFKLVAFPDFMLANRFNLSTVERPFIFSIFVIGGTGYMQVEAEYKPIKNELTVLVEAGAGGSAQLGFAFGPISGQVFITLSGVLSYRKTIGKSGGGLSIAVVLVIAGHVDVAGIATVGITLVLRMTYRDSGQIDANGTLTVSIRISRFFTLRARAQANYKMRGGKSESSVTTSTSAELEGKAAEVEKAANKLQGAMK